LRNNFSNITSDEMSSLIAQLPLLYARRKAQCDGTSEFHKVGEMLDDTTIKATETKNYNLLSEIYHSGIIATDFRIKSTPTDLINWINKQCRLEDYITKIYLNIVFNYYAQNMHQYKKPASPTLFYKNHQNKITEKYKSTMIKKDYYSDLDLDFESCILNDLNNKIKAYIDSVYKNAKLMEAFSQNKVRRFLAIGKSTIKPRVKHFNRNKVISLHSTKYLSSKNFIDDNYILKLGKGIKISIPVESYKDITKNGNLLKIQIKIVLGDPNAHITFIIKKNITESDFVCNGNVISKNNHRLEEIYNNFNSILEKEPELNERNQGVFGWDYLRLRDTTKEFTHIKEQNNFFLRNVAGRLPPLSLPDDYIVKRNHQFFELPEYMGDMETEAVYFMPDIKTDSIKIFYNSKNIRDLWRFLNNTVDYKKIITLKRRLKTDHINYSTLKIEFEELVLNHSGTKSHHINKKFNLIKSKMARLKRKIDSRTKALYFVNPFEDKDFLGNFDFKLLALYDDLMSQDEDIRKPKVSINEQPLIWKPIKTFQKKYDINISEDTYAKLQYDPLSINCYILLKGFMKEVSLRTKRSKSDWWALYYDHKNMLLERMQYKLLQAKNDKIYTSFLYDSIHLQSFEHANNNLQSDKDDIKQLQDLYFKAQKLAIKTNKGYNTSQLGGNFEIDLLKAIYKLNYLWFNCKRSDWEDEEVIMLKIYNVITSVTNDSTNFAFHTDLDRALKKVKNYSFKKTSSEFIKSLVFNIKNAYCDHLKIVY